MLGPSGKGWWVCPVLGGVFLCAVTFARTHEYALLGFDTYPIILTSRVTSWDDLMANFTRKLMGGRFAGDFYRPFLSLSFALDYVLWGLRPVGYQLTNAVLFGGSGVAVFFLTRRLLGPGAVLAPWVALGAIAFHAIPVEVIPVPARRGELMAWSFMAFSLFVQLSPRGLAGALKPKWIAVGLALLAMGSKETAYLLPGFVLAGGWLLSEERLFRNRLGTALRITAPHAVALAMVMGIRVAILGGVGGYASTSLAKLPERAPEVLWASIKYLVAPQPPMWAVEVLGGKVVLLILLAALVGAWFCLGTFRGKPGRRGGSRLGKGLAFVLLWHLVISFSFALAGRTNIWYLFLLVPGLAMGLGLLTQVGWSALGQKERAVRVWGAVTLVAAVALLGWEGRYSPLVYSYPGWGSATRMSEQFLDGLRQQIDAVPDGTVVPAAPVPRWVRVTPGSVAVRGGAILSGYSLQAWLELEFADRGARLRERPGGKPPLGEVWVVPTGLAPGFDGP